MESQLTARLAGRLAERVHAAQLPWAAHVVSWMDLVDLCRELDESLVAANAAPSEEVLALHQAVVTLAIGSGSWLLHQLQVNKLDFSGSGQTFETLSASLELLRILYRSRHSDFPPDQIAAVRQKIFNAPA